MKLSEAILKGCELTKPHKRGYFNNMVKEELTHACALGAAIVATNGFRKKGISLSNYVNKAERKYSILNKRLIDLPEELYNKFFKDLVTYRKDKWGESSQDINIKTAIIYLNDVKEWSREAIAIWISTLEDYLEKESEKNLQNAEKNPVKTTGVLE